MVTIATLSEGRKKRKTASMPVFGAIFLAVLLLGVLSKLLLGKASMLDDLYSRVIVYILGTPYSLVDLMPDYGWFAFCLPGCLLIFIHSARAACRKGGYLILVILEVLSFIGGYGLWAINLFALSYIPVDYHALLLTIYRYCSYACVGIHAFAAFLTLFDSLLLGNRFREVYKLRRIRLDYAKTMDDKAAAAKEFKRLWAKRLYSEMLEFLYEPYWSLDSALPLDKGAIEYLIYSGAIYRKKGEEVRLRELCATGQITSLKLERAHIKEEYEKAIGDKRFVDPATIAPYLKSIADRNRIEVEPNAPSEKLLKQAKKEELKAKKEMQRLQKADIKKAGEYSIPQSR